MAMRDRNFVSEVDQFLTEFDKSHPQLTESQKKEIAKSKRIAKLQQEKQSLEQAEKIWEKF